MSSTTASKPPVVKVAVKKKRWYARWLAALGLNSLLFSIIGHLVFAVAAAYLVVWHFQAKRHDFPASTPVSGQSQQVHVTQMAKRNNPASAPRDLKRITTTEISPITLPDVPVPTPTDVASESQMSGVGVDGFLINGGPGDPGLGGKDKGVSLPYGWPKGEGLAGTLYDLKQTIDGQPTDMAENDTEKSIGANVTDPGFANSPQTHAQLAFLSHFVTDWNMSDLDTYYKSDQTLKLAQLCIPEQASNQATIDFQVADKVVARRWIAIYHAKIIPPEGGTFRFIGFGDDFLVVNIDGKNVLDGSFQGERLDPSANVNENVGQAWGGQSLNCGQWFQLQAGLAADMQILIGEGPGGASGFVLMIQEKGDNSSPGDYPVFQVGDIPIPDGMNIPNFSKKKLLFQLSE